MFFYQGPRNGDVQIICSPVRDHQKSVLLLYLQKKYPRNLHFQPQEKLQVLDEKRKPKRSQILLDLLPSMWQKKHKCIHETLNNVVKQKMVEHN